MRWSYVAPSLAALLALWIIAACEKGDKPPPRQGEIGLTQETGPANAKKPPSGEPTDAERMFVQVCGMCHGMDGTGRGPASETLNPKPRDYTDVRWQNSVTDDEIKRTIILGGAGVGKSAMMPPNPKLKDDPETVDGLVEIIRNFGKGKKPRM